MIKTDQTIYLIYQMRCRGNDPDILMQSFRFKIIQHYPKAGREDKTFEFNSPPSKINVNAHHQEFLNLKDFVEEKLGIRTVFLQNFYDAWSELEMARGKESEKLWDINDYRGTPQISAMFMHNVILEILEDFMRAKYIYSKFDKDYTEKSNHWWDHFVNYLIYPL